jgi:hypothetical protein
MRDGRGVSGGSSCDARGRESGFVPLPCHPLHRAISSVLTKRLLLLFSQASPKRPTSPSSYALLLTPTSFPAFKRKTADDGLGYLLEQKQAILSSSFVLPLLLVFSSLPRRRLTFFLSSCIQSEDAHPCSALRSSRSSMALLYEQRRRLEGKPCSSISRLRLLFSSFLQPHAYHYLPSISTSLLRTPSETICRLDRPSSKLFLLSTLSGRKASLWTFSADVCRNTPSPPFVCTLVEKEAESLYIRFVLWSIRPSKGSLDPSELAKENRLLATGNEPGPPLPTLPTPPPSTEADPPQLFRPTKPFGLGPRPPKRRQRSR